MNGRTGGILSKIAIIGAGGNSGRPMAEELIKTGKHTVTALTRPDSKSTLPQGVKSIQVDYSNHESLVEALKGQEVLIITLAPMAPADTQSQLIKAAAEAKVSWILPNEWSPDCTDEGLIKDVPVFRSKPKAREEIAATGKTSFIAISTGFWYEWSLALPGAFGFNVPKKTVTFFDDGTTPISICSWPQVGRAVAQLLSLPEQSESGAPSLADYRNKTIYVNSFTVSQKDIFASVLRATGDRESDWTVSYEPSHERYAAGAAALKGGERVGFAKMMYSRVFYPEGSVGNTEKTKGLANKAIGLAPEKLDDTTPAAIERARAGLY